MHIFERLLLYAVTLTSIILLFENEPASEVPVSKVNPPEDFVSLAVDSSENPSSSANEKTAPLATESGRPLGGGLPTRNEIVLKDRQGRSRIEMRIGLNDEPQIVLKDQNGQDVIALSVNESGSGQIALAHKKQRVAIGPDAQGDLAVMLRGPQAEEIRLSLSEDGEAKVIAKGRSPSTVALSSRADGAADVQIHRGPDTGGPLMAVQNNGEAAIGIANDDREYGPVMHLFEDGLGQFTITGQGSDSGPSLIRTPDGTSIVSVRHGNGQPAAAMIGSPTGASIMTVTNQAGTQQAALRSDKGGKVDIGIIESEPGEKPAPKPLPKPPRVPQIELIHHAPERPEEIPLSAPAVVAELSNISSK